LRKLPSAPPGSSDENCQLRRTSPARHRHRQAGHRAAIERSRALPEMSAGRRLDMRVRVWIEEHQGLLPHPAQDGRSSETRGLSLKAACSNSAQFINFSKESISLFFPFFVQNHVLSVKIAFRPSGSVKAPDFREPDRMRSNQTASNRSPPAGRQSPANPSRLGSGPLASGPVGTSR
jgi:hypothetical protein